MMLARMQALLDSWSHSNVPNHTQKMDSDSLLSLEQLKTLSGGAAEKSDFCIDPWVLKWKLSNPGKELPPFLGGPRNRR